MKGMSSHDGKMHGNVQVIERYDESKGKKKQTPKASGGESGGEHEPSGHDEVKKVVGEHGAAHTIEVKGMDVTSHHEDGHVHNSSHGSAAEAHAAAAHLGGVTDPNELREAHEGFQEQDTLDEAGHRSRIERSSHRAHAGGGFMPEHGIED